MESIKALDAKSNKAFYGDRISDNMTITPEGFLICHNVPIGRVGAQDYLGKEIGIYEKSDELIPVMREEGEVFSPESIASFEGKPITDGHPGEDVDPTNYTRHLKGHTTNVRKGDGSDKDKLVADLVIYDKQLIDEIQNGKREVSCGYDCMYEIDDEGRIYQTSIRGNHVAIVDLGRAGHRVRIKDEKPKKERGTSIMKKPSIIARILGLAKDADPAEVAEIIESVQELQDAIGGDDGKTPDSQPAAVAADTDQPAAQDSEVMGKVLDMLKGINDKLAAMDNKSESDPLQALEDELAGEDKVTEPVEKIDDSEPIDEASAEDTALNIADEEKATDAEPVKSNDSLLEIVRSIKPIIAGISDSDQRKKATDALTASVRQLQGKQAKPETNGYRTILHSKEQHAKKQTRDTQPVDFTKQQDIYDGLNPHKKGGN